MQWLTHAFVSKREERIIMASSENVAKLEDSTNEDIRRLTHTQRALMRLKKDYLTIISLGLVFLLILLAVTAPIITEMMGVDPESEDLGNIYASPSFENEHILGTDDKGRDHFARLLFGAQIS